EVKILDLATRKEVLALRSDSGAVHSLAYSPDGRWLAIAASRYAPEGTPLPSEVKLWDAIAGKVTVSLPGHLDTIGSVTFSPDGKWLAAGGFGTVKVWNLAKRQEAATLAGHFDYEVTSVAFSADSERLASGSLDQSVKIWGKKT